MNTVLPRTIGRRYVLLDGSKVSLAGLTAKESIFLKDLLRMARKDEDYFDIYARACGPGSIALRGHSGLTRALAETPLYLAARDLATRAGIQQHLILAPEHEARRHQLPTDGSTVSVTQAAEILGISRAAVHKAIQGGKIRSQRIGNVILADRMSVLEYGERPAKPRATRRPARHGHRTETPPLPVATKGRA